MTRPAVDVIAAIIDPGITERVPVEIIGYETVNGRRSPIYQKKQPDYAQAMERVRVATAKAEEIDALYGDGA